MHYIDSVRCAGRKDGMDMKREEKTHLWAGIGFLTVFLLWTALIRRVDVQAAGPNGTKVGFAGFNLWFHKQTGVHMTLYTITDWLGVFEMIPINYRPILIGGVLEVSYPSSTTLLVLSVMPTLKLQMDRRTDHPLVRNVTGIFVAGFSAFMVTGRLMAGVHWATDIIGAVFLSAGLFMLYRAAVRAAGRRREDRNGIQ